jgi:hypothetical protein
MSGTYVGLAVAVNSLTGGGVTNALGLGPESQSGASVAGAADPFSPYRSNLAANYYDSLKPGGNTDITQMPGYSQFQTGVMDPALEASKRSAASSGMLRSGNEQIALEQTAQKGYYGFMTDYLNRLAQGSGATNNPATAVGMGVNQNNANAAGVMQGMGALGTSLAGLYGGNTGYTMDTSGYGIGSGGMGTIDTADYGGAYGPSIR